MEFPIKIEYHSPYNEMPWTSNDSLKFKPSPIISVPTYMSSAEQSGYIELVINPKFAEYTDEPSASDISLVLYKQDSNDVIIDITPDAINVTPLDHLVSSIDPSFSVSNVQSIQYDLTDSLISVLNKVIEGHPNGISARINYSGTTINNSSASSYLAKGLIPSAISIGNSYIDGQVKEKVDENNYQIKYGSRSWNLDWGIIDPTKTYLNHRSRYFNPDSNDFSIGFESNIEGNVTFEFVHIASDSSLPGITNAEFDNDMVKVSSSHFLENNFPEGLYSIQTIVAQSNQYSFPVFKNMLLDKTAPVIDAISPLPGLREDKISGHIISNSDTVIFKVKDTPFWSIDENNSFSYYESLSYGLEIIMDDLDTIFIDSGLINVDDYFMAEIDYDLKEILPGAKEGSMRIQLNLNDNTGNKGKGSFLFTLQTNVGGKIVADKMFNYPNPFSSTAGSGTNIRYTLLSESSSGKLIILNSGGNLVYLYNLVGDELTAGTHTIFWDGLSIFNYKLSPGVYFGFLDFNGEIIRSKIAIIN